MKLTTEKESRPHNTGFALGGVLLRQAQHNAFKFGALCFNSGSVQVDSFVPLSPTGRKARKRWGEH